MRQAVGLTTENYESQSFDVLMLSSNCIGVVVPNSTKHSWNGIYFHCSCFKNQSEYLSKFRAQPELRRYSPTFILAYVSKMPRTRLTPRILPFANPAGHFEYTSHRRMLGKDAWFIPTIIQHGITISRNGEANIFEGHLEMGLETCVYWTLGWRINPTKVFNITSNRKIL